MNWEVIGAVGEIVGAFAVVLSLLYLARVWEDAFHQHQQKRLNDAQWHAMVVQFSSYLGLPGVAAVWSIRKAAYSEDFRAFVGSTTAGEYRTK